MRSLTGIAILAVSALFLMGCAQPRTDGPLADRPSFDGCIPVPADGQLFISSFTIDPNNPEGESSLTIESVSYTSLTDEVLQATPVLASIEDVVPGWLAPSGEATFESLGFTELPASYDPEGGIVAVGLLVQFADGITADEAAPVLTADSFQYSIDGLGAFITESHRSVWLTREPVESEGFCAAFNAANQ